MRAGRGDADDDDDDVADAGGGGAGMLFFFSGGHREARASTSERKLAKGEPFGDALAFFVDDALAPRPKLLSQA